MKIKSLDLECSWWEDEEGHKIFPKHNNRIPQRYIYYHQMFPFEITHRCIRSVVKEEVEQCKHPVEHIRKTYGWIDGIEGRECALCNGTQTKYIDESWPDMWEADGFRTIFEGQTTWSADLVLSMANSGDYSLYESIIISANSCERCINSLAYKYGLSWGYCEGSEDWHKANTSCDYCTYRGLSQKDLRLLKKLDESIKLQDRTCVEDRR